MEVWFDRNELRGGDVWDRQIHERIHDCRLFIAVMLARRRWKPRAGGQLSPHSGIDAINVDLAL
jgi:hypothetical protein